MTRSADRPTWWHLTWWSVVTVVLAVPTWWTVLRGAVLSRDVDGGIFLSVAGGIGHGLRLYSEIWDNKDPLFYAVFFGADQLGDVGPFLTDWLWLPLAALGAWLLARSVVSADRALFLALVATPWLVAGSMYVAGWSSTPGTALVLLGLGLLARRRFVAAGIVLGLVVFTKIALAPVGLAAALVLVVVRSSRRAGLRALAAWVLTVIAGFGVLWSLGWLAGYLDMIPRNRAYADAAMTYFGYASTLGGHLDKMRSDLSAGMAVAVLLVLVTMVAGAVRLSSRSWRDERNVLLVAWLWVAAAGSLAVLAFTYVWPHHAQVLALPSVLALVTLAAVVPEGVPYPVLLPVAVVATFVLAGWGSVTSWVDHVRFVDGSFATAVAQADEVPLNAVLVNSVPEDDFRFAILGTNDERGFLRDVRPGATLGCPQFHLYDFSPVSDFDNAWACIDTVDALVLTDGFVAFGNGGRAGSVQPILDKVDALFTCTRVSDRQLCLRRQS